MKRTCFPIVQPLRFLSGKPLVPSKRSFDELPILPRLRPPILALSRGTVKLFHVPPWRPGHSQPLALRRPCHMGDLLSVAQHIPHAHWRPAGQGSIDSTVRTFHSSAPRQDVFFVAFPALKAQLLNVTRICLVVLPFVYRYKWVIRSV